jgi:hypothetical protein
LLTFLFSRISDVCMLAQSKVKQQQYAFLKTMFDLLEQKAVHLLAAVIRFENLLKKKTN